jgi:hypothetical protein
MNTGKLDVLFEGEMSELLLVRSENEKMLTGQNVPTSILDGHRMHILEHKALIADPDLRQNPVLLERVQNHIQEHINHLRTADPDLLQLIGEQPLNPPQDAAAPQLPAGPMQNQEVIQGSPMPDMQQPQNLTDMQAPNAPKPPGVDPNLLPNPGIQEQQGAGVLK